RNLLPFGRVVDFVGCCIRGGPLSDCQATGRGIEVGHIFYFGTKYSEAMGAKVTGPDGQEHAVHMGSYGIGPSRVAAAAIEAGHDSDGIIWPRAIAPFDLGIISMKPDDSTVAEAAEKIYQAALTGGYDPLLDDRDLRAGQKFAGMDLVGLPEQITVGPRGLEKGEVELKKRGSGEKDTISLDEMLNRLAAGSH
ncbi:MAG: His/Gly/Thr/Pro-type tRNA ligase C-terminal domain-containing protein, partial [Pseudomonadota bacterium]